MKPRQSKRVALKEQLFLTHTVQMKLRDNKIYKKEIISS